MYKQLVLAIFPSETAADQAAAELKRWDKANEDIKTGAIGVLVKDNWFTGACRTSSCSC